MGEIEENEAHEEVLVGGEVVGARGAAHSAPRLLVGRGDVEEGHERGVVRQKDK